MMALESVQFTAYTMPWGLGTGSNQTTNGGVITGYTGSPQGCYNSG